MLKKHFFRKRTMLISISVMSMMILGVVTVLAAPLGANAGDVLINEFTAKGTEWIELYNTTGSTIDLTDWKLSDGEGDEALSGTISAGDYFVTSTPLGLSNTGDEIMLYDDLGTLIDEVAYGTKGGAPLPIFGDSTARSPDGFDSDDFARDWNLDQSPTQGSANDAPGTSLGSGVVINEQNAYSPGGDFYELYNPTGSSVDVTGWQASDGDDLRTLTGSIAAGGFLTFTNLSITSSDVMYLWDASGVRVDQLGRVPEFEDGTFQRILDGAGPNDGFDFASSGGGVTYFDCTGTPGAPNFCAPPPVEICGDAHLPIYTIQGSGSASPLDGVVVSTEGVVTGDFQTSAGLRGFFIQESIGDGNASTSDGIFVFDGGSPGTDVEVGDFVRVRGTVAEYFDLTELSGVSLVLICGSNTVPTATPINLPVGSLSDIEPFEGMLVSFPQTLYATDNFGQGQYGEVTLSVNDRLDNPTNVVAPGGPAIALKDLNTRSQIQLDDGSGIQNPLPLPPYLGSGNTLRAGDTVPGVTGVLGYAFGVYELHPTEPVAFSRQNDRPLTPPSVGGSLKVASFNVLNYFTTLDNSGPICGPLGDQGCRGADNAFEFTQQRDKIIDAIVKLDADVLGLMEIENNASAAVQDLVDGLNAVEGAGTYAFIDTGTIGSDAIKVAFLYKPSSVTPIGAFAILDSSVDPDFNDDKNRPALAQTFLETVTYEVQTIVVNHLKSKGSDCNALGDPDIGDGQGNCNLTRTSAAEALANWLATDPTGSGSDDFLIIGDLNAYAMEDPVTALEGAGYEDLIETYEGLGAYSYVFFGEAGYLDHALSSSSLSSRVTGATFWHINADEPRALDYNDFNQPLLYSPDPFRSSDHDPVVVGIVGICETTPPLLEVSVTPDTLWPPKHKYVEVRATVIVSDNLDPDPTVTLVSVTSNEPDEGLGDGDTPDDIVIVDDFTFDLRAERSGSGEGRIYTITYLAEDGCGNTNEVSATVLVPHDKPKK